MHITHIKSYFDKKVLINLLIAAVLLTLGAIFLYSSRATAAVGGPQCRVPVDYLTIQAALDDINCQVLKVDAGTYNENLTINRAVKLRGAKAGVPIDTRSYAGAGETSIAGSSAAAVTVNADGVVVDGFSITNTTGHLGIVVKSVATDVKIQNNIISGITSASANPTGVYLELGPDSVNVRGNKIENLSGTGFSAQGVLVGDSTSADPSLDIKLDNNVFSNITSTKGAYGINVNNGSDSETTSTGYTEVKMRGNNISDLEGDWAHAIGLEGETPNAIVRYNKISQIVDVSPVSGFYNAVGVFFENNQFYFTVQVNRNDLNVGENAFGVALALSLTNRYPSLSVDAECNWWGDKNGPSVYPATDKGSWVGPQVDSEPWLRSDNLNGKCGNRWNQNEDDDHHHGDKDCRYDDVRGNKYRD